MEEIERRYFADTPELRAGDGEKMQLRGTGIVFNSWSEDLGGFREMIEPGAVEGMLDGDIRSFFNHDPSHVLGRTKSGTMRLEVRKGGVAYEVDLPDNTIGRDVHVSVSRGDVDGSSFAFTVEEDEWNTDKRPAERRIKRFGKIMEMGPVSMPAYPKAKVSARALEMAKEESPPTQAPRHHEHERLLLAES